MQALKLNNSENISLKFIARPAISFPIFDPCQSFLFANNTQQHQEELS
jgi:hypothetical protein